MITIGFSTKKIDDDYVTQLQSTCGIKAEIIPFENPGTHSLASAYNIILDQASNDYVVLVHDDLIFKNDWGATIYDLMGRHDEYGIIGVAGTKELHENGIWWEHGQHYGNVYHLKNNQPIPLNMHHPDGDVQEVCVVDALFLALSKNRIVKWFDEDFDSFHFYDISFCVANYLAGVKIGSTAQIPVIHRSCGSPDEVWERYRTIFLNKYINSLPIKV
jgi:glycosyltransferase involved in cell wall biosynthesis